MPMLRRQPRKAVDSVRSAGNGATNDGPEAQWLMTLDEFILAHKLSTYAEQALRSKPEAVIQRVLSQGPLEGGNPNLALAERLWSEQAGCSERPQAQQIRSERQVDDAAYTWWNRWRTAKGPGCCVVESHPCKHSVVDPIKVEAPLKDGKHVQLLDTVRDTARVGNGNAQCVFAGHCENNTANDHAQAVEWYIKAAEQGEADVHSCELAAKQGDVEAQFELGLCYKHGIGVTRDLELALEWFTKAGKKAHIQAQFNVALCYQHGEGVNVDATKAANWFKKAASKGHSRSQFQLGRCHSKGLGVPREAFFAFIMFKAAALQGLDVAEYKLAKCYHRGAGVEKDAGLAAEWYARAAEQGHSKAQYKLAVCYLKGDGVPPDVQQGMTWMQRAAEQGHPTATAVLED